jgi:hypothetical protein
MRVRRLLRWWPAAAVTSLAGLVYAAWPGSWTFTIGPETTYITAPVDKNGYVDYPTALNERLGKGVTPDTNANVLLWQALGPHPEGGTMPPDYFRWLGAPSPPEDGEYFIPWNKYVRDNFKDPPRYLFGWLRGPSEWKLYWENHVSKFRSSPWRLEEEPQVAAWLRQNEKPLAVAIEGSKRLEYYNPLVSKKSDPASARLIGSLLPNVQECRGIALALACRAMARTAYGEMDGAWTDLMACQRLGRLIGRSGTMIESLVGIAIAAIANDAQIVLIGHGVHTRERLRKWLAEVRALPQFPSMADKFDLAERCMTLDSLTSVIASRGQANFPPGGIGGTLPSDLSDRLFSPSIDWDPALRMINETYDRLAAAARMPDRRARSDVFDGIMDEFEQRKIAGEGLAGQLTASRGDRGLAIGNIIMGLMMPAFDKLLNAKDRAEQIHRNLIVALALAAYRADTGRFPARLEDVAPKYLAAVPGDLFTGKPLIYRPAEDGYLFYSVGVNGLDEGGQSYGDEPRGDDLAVRMPPKEPARK